MAGQKERKTEKGEREGEVERKEGGEPEGGREQETRREGQKH